MKFIVTSIKSFIILLFLFAVAHTNAQELLGLTLGNYSGTAGLLINPAGMTTNKVYLDINLVTANLFARNNFAYLPKEDFVIWDAFKKGYKFPVYGDDNKSVIYYKNQNLKHYTINARVLGPSVMLQIGDHAFGITTGVRYFMSGHKVPWDVAEFAYNGLEYTPLQNIEFDDNDFNLNTSAWMEVGLSYANIVQNTFDHQISIGISVKKLWGYGGASLKVDNINYVVVDDTTINIKNLNNELAFSLPMDYDNGDFITSNPTFRGSGVGIDIGAVYIKKKHVGKDKWKGKKLCSQKYEDYIYRIGVSILDIGRVKYTTNAQLHSFDDVSKYWSSLDTIGYTNINTLMSEVSNTLLGDPNASLISNTMKIGLPTALSVQADFNLENNLYVGAMWIHPLRINNNALRRPAQLAVVPRFETKHFEMSLPLSLFEYRYPRVGIAARFDFLTIGTERLGTYLGMADMNGLDIYASIKIGINKGSCKKKFGGACSNESFGNQLFKRKNRR